MIASVGLAGKEDTPVGNLTLIDRKRVEIAKALAGNPKLLLLDEPLAGLNPSEIAEFLDLIRKIHDSGVTLVIVEHVLKALMSIASRVVVLHLGRKIAEGKPEDVVRMREVIKVYLGETYALT